MQRLLSTVLVLGLLVATSAAFAVTERLKLTKSPIFGTLIDPVLSPRCACVHDRALIRFRLRHRDTLTLDILDARGRSVRRLADAQPVARGRHAWTWDGRTDAGGVASGGQYRPRVHLSHRTIVFPNAIVLDAKPPQVVSAKATRDVFSPDGDRQSDSVTLAYRLSERAHALVFLNGERIIRSHFAPQRGSVKWYGRLHQRTLPPGTYTLEVRAEDSAGNVTTKPARVVVRIRYIALATHRLAGIRAGTRFGVRVDTDARAFHWSLGARRGVARSDKPLVLRAPAKPGRYRLVVEERGHIDRATVIVVARA